MTTFNRLKLKNNDHILEDIDIIPLISSIEDIEGVILEHSKLNSNSKRLEFALIMHGGEYYFIDCKKSIREDVYITDGKNYICPCCMQELELVPSFKKNGKIVKSYLRHKHNSNECDFKNYYNNCERDIKNKELFTGEGYLHKKLKLSTLRNIVDEGIELPMPNGYKIELQNNKLFVKFNYKDVLLIDAEAEKRALKGDEITKGTRPDITAYTDEGETVYIEVTNKSGKTVKEYYSIWERLGKPVIEVRSVDNIDKSIDYKDCYEDGEFDKEFYYEEIIKEDKVFRMLFHPVIEKARKERLDLKTKMTRDINEKQLREFVNRNLYQINMDAKKNKISKMPVSNIIFEDKKCKYIGFNGFEYPCNWYKIIFKGVCIYRSMPSKIYLELKNRCSCLTIVRN